MGYTLLITGAGSGLGQALCTLHALDFERILVTDRDRFRAEETATLVQRQVPRGAAVEASELDVSDPGHVATWFGSHREERIDVLINNAGLQHVESLEQFPAAKWSHLIDVMLKGPALMTQGVLPGMRSRNFGRILHIGSIHSLVASPYKSAYVAAKHGLLGLTKTVALETGDVDITINTICPSYIRTPLVEQQIAEQAKLHGIPAESVISDIMLAPMPKRAFITAEEIAGTIRFLISPAARNLTGQAITIDGGWTAR
jgi:3-hydroxybutyrate dehydrogenase